MCRAASGLPLASNVGERIEDTREELLAVQPLGKSGWYETCIIGKDGNRKKEIDKSACPKAVRTPIDWLLFRPSQAS